MEGKWRYLTAHAHVFAARKSSIYRGKPPFSIFGVGRYSFAPYKVLVSGLHKQPRFVVAGPRHGRPALCDDTCYLLPFESAPEAAALQRINIGTLLQAVSSEVLNKMLDPLAAQSTPEFSGTVWYPELKGVSL